MNGVAKITTNANMTHTNSTSAENEQLFHLENGSNKTKVEQQAATHAFTGKVGGRMRRLLLMAKRWGQKRR